MITMKNKKNYQPAKLVNYEAQDIEVIGGMNIEDLRVESSFSTVSFRRYRRLIKSKYQRRIEQYGDDYEEIIKHKWEMRKLKRKLEIKLPEKNQKEGVRKI